MMPGNCYFSRPCPHLDASMPDTASPLDIVIFGAAGDLALRKLMPALYRLTREARTGLIGRIVGCGRSALSDEAYRELVGGALKRHANAGTASADFLGRVSYATLDATTANYDALAQALAERNAPRLFYLATAPELFGPICRQLAQQQLITPGSRVVLEKPIGGDLASCHAIHDEVATAFPESAIFRIDHYLGKEAVQNLLALRFGNALLMPVWSNQYISHVQITVAEAVGVEGRTSYYTKFGAFRDMVQNHLLQLLCLVAMEPPNSLQADAIRTEKLKVLQALTPFDADYARRHLVRGQYRAGVVQGQPVPGYDDEVKERGDAATETFVALRVGIDNWRWAGVPFYLRTGKRLSKRCSDIVIEFKPQPFSIFGAAEDGRATCNRLLIRLQPEENITLWMMNKEPGLDSGMQLQPVALDLLDSVQAAYARNHDAYERLLLDVLNGRQTLFMHRDEVETAWRWADGAIAAWREQADMPLPYAAGSMGPAAAAELMRRDGLGWFEL